MELPAGLVGRRKVRKTWDILLLKGSGGTSVRLGTREKGEKGFKRRSFSLGGTG